MREQKYSVLAALRTGPPGPGRSQPAGRAQMSAACRLAGAGPRVRARGRRGVHRQRPRYDLAKLQLFRTLDDVNPHPALAQLESEILEEANRLGVGAMGFGGKASLIGCKIGVANRLPASYFVSVAYDCWAFRRLGVRLDASTGAITQWLYRDPARPVERMARGEGFPLTGREIILTPPLTEGQMRALKVGDVVLINGEMFTGRDN